MAGHADPWRCSMNILMIAMVGQASAGRGRSCRLRCWGLASSAQLPHRAFLITDPVELMRTLVLDPIGMSDSSFNQRFPHQQPGLAAGGHHVTGTAVLAAGGRCRKWPAPGRRRHRLPRPLHQRRGRRRSNPRSRQPGSRRTGRPGRGGIQKREHAPRRIDPPGRSPRPVSARR
jgi:hypothetical protein